MQTTARKEAASQWYVELTEVATEMVSEFGPYGSRPLAAAAQTLLSARTGSHADVVCRRASPPSLVGRRLAR
jgi:hypothetical protein